MVHRHQVVSAALALVFAAVAAAASAQNVPLAISGTVLDQTGAVLPGAVVSLIDPAAAVVQTTTTSGDGTFRFDRVPQGQFQIEASFEGFKTSRLRVRVGPRQTAPQTIVLNLADVEQEVTVSNQDAEVDAKGSSNQDAVTVDQNMLDALPIFGQDFIGTLSRFLDAGAVGNGGVTIVLNGMEVSALNVSPSAIQQIKINQDPYSAEFSRPGRGRIEILTKPGSQAYHGESNAILRDARFNARNPFAAVRAPEQRHIFEGMISGPVGHGGKTTFVLSATDSYESQQAAVFALGPFGALRDTVAQPHRRTLGSVNITRQYGQNTTISIRPAYQYERDANRGAGGTTLASAATTFEHREEQVTYTQQTIIRPTLLHQFQLLAGHEREPTTSASAATGIVVAGAFTGGGAGESVLRTERHIQLTESLAWTTPHHLVQVGFQLPDWSRRGFFDRSNIAGTFSFADLEAYAAGRPYAFTQQRGNGDVLFLEKQVGLYAKDDWQLRPGLSASFGLRYDWQNYFHDGNNLAPRFSMAYSPGDKKRDVFRAGVGIFNDRSGPVVIADLLHDRPGGLVRYVIANPSYPDPFAGGAAVSSPGPSVVRLARDVQIPQTLQYSVGVDHQLQKATTLSVTYTGSHGYHLFLSRDVNAPAPPLYLERPDRAFGAIREVESSGRQRTHSIQIGLRGRVTRWFNGQTQYSWSRSYNDTNGIGWFAANDYDQSGEWARADFDRRHRLALLGRIGVGKMFDLGAGLTLNSGAPYTEMVGQDVYNNGRGRARPVGVPRNTLEGDGYADLDLRVSRDLTFGKGAQARAATFSLDAFNLFNRVNYSTYVGTVGSPLFGRAVGARDPRQLQLSLRYRF